MARGPLPAPTMIRIIVATPILTGLSRDILTTPYRTQQEQQAKRQAELQKNYDRALEWLSRQQGRPEAQERAYRKYWAR
jgi:hypothetical protein